MGRLKSTPHSENLKQKLHIKTQNKMYIENGDKSNFLRHLNYSGRIVSKNNY